MLDKHPSLLARRLKLVMKDGNLTTSDLGGWFERSRGAIDGWLRGGSPRNFADEVERRLLVLEAYTSRYQLVSYNVKPKNRHAHIKEVLHRVLPDTTASILSTGHRKLDVLCIADAQALLDTIDLGTSDDHPA